MAKFSDKRLSKSKQDEIWNEFCTIVSSLETKEDVRRFFCDLFNRQERLMVARRLQIAALLDAGLTYDEIARSLRVGKPTIARVQRWLNFGREGYKRAIKRIVFRETKISERFNRYYHS